MCLSAGETCEAVQDALGQALACLVVGAGVGGTGGQALGTAPGQEACHGLAARMVGVENLGEEDPERDERGEESLAEGDGLVADGLFGQTAGQEFAERQGWGVGNLLTKLSDLATAAWGGSMSHGWPPCGEVS